jgi:hypothetical protein
MSPIPSTTSKRAASMASSVKIHKMVGRASCKTSSRAAPRKARKLSKTAQFHERMTKGCKIYQGYTGSLPFTIISGMIDKECHHPQCYKLAIESGAWYGYEMYYNIHTLLERGRIAIVQLLWEATEKRKREYFAECVLHSLPKLITSCRRDIISTIFANNMHSLPDDYDLMDNTCFVKDLADLHHKIVATAVNAWDHDTIKLCLANLPIHEKVRLSMISDAIIHPHTPMLVLQALGQFRIDDLKAFPAAFRAYDLAAKPPQFTQYLRTMGLDARHSCNSESCFLSAIRYGNAPLAQYWADQGVNVAIAKNLDRWLWYNCDAFVSNTSNDDIDAQHVPVPTKMQCYDLLVSWGIPIHKHRTRAKFVNQNSIIV